jgi:uncharacterized OsmC-like protein
MTETRRYDVAARSTDVFGRVLLTARQHRFLSDGPVHNEAAGEEITPAELFLAGVASCAVELVQVIARREDVPLAGVETAISGEIEPDNPVRPDVALFNRVRLDFRLVGVTDEQAEALVERFKHT